MKKRYKNWANICRIGEADGLLMLVLATADLEAKTAQRLIVAFPECFCEEETQGPYPLSLLRAEAHKESIRQGGSEDGGSHPYAFEVIPRWIPFQNFDKFGRREAGFEGPILPKEINPNAKQGEVVVWGGKKFVVLENNESCQEICIAPAECIAVDV